jgi:hypothetical protein
VVLVWKSGNSSGGGGNVGAAADSLRQQFGAHILAISAAGRVSPEDQALVGPHGRVFAFDGWREADHERLGQVADHICKALFSSTFFFTQTMNHTFPLALQLVPQSRKPPSAGALPWPIRQKSTPPPTEPASAIPRDCRRVDYPVDLVMALDATNFEQAQFGKILESLATLADESFDLSPDVVRLGLLVYRSPLCGHCHHFHAFPFQ